MAQEIEYGERYIELRLSGLGAQVAKAYEMLGEVEELCVAISLHLAAIQKDIADLYETLADVVNPKKEQQADM